ncbi:uncharacterized protein LOC111627249 [Centruroides sculpturatus]|uniref:uncharacterized protein LOC111627249 n=1 Tax=Centruroides sculpturatus TaxID=218467 RepID=UPI000C6E541E|nr:uncharacterized protein LOC111627249 [Centruroides sculpturatus]
MAKLYLVATPIGNSQDLTFRAKDTLEKVTYIACEDTRRIRKLLAIYGLKGKKLLVHHAHNERQSTPGIIRLVEQGVDVALVSDAGTPGIADPGFLLMRAAIEKNLPVEVIPGVSALTTAVVLANLDQFFTFLGFLSARKIKRQNQLKKLPVGTFVIYVPPHQLISTLEDLAHVYQDEVDVFVGKELTKQFETH